MKTPINYSPGDCLEVLDGRPSAVGRLLGALLTHVHHMAWSFPIPSVDYERIRAGVVPPELATQYDPPGIRALEQAHSLERFFDDACGHLPDERVRAWFETHVLGHTQRDAGARMGVGVATIRRWSQEVNEALCTELARRDWRIS